MSKKIEFLNLPLGALFSSHWRRNRDEDISWYYRCTVDLEMHEVNIKQSFLHRILFGKAPKTMKWAEKKYNYTDVKWMSTEEVVPPKYDFKEYMIEIFDDGRLESSREKVLDTFYEIVNACPSDDVLVFGYGLKSKGNRIEPEVIPCGIRKEGSVWIKCGFAGF